MRFYICLFVLCSLASLLLLLSLSPVDAGARKFFKDVPGKRRLSKPTIQPETFDPKSPETLGTQPNSVELQESQQPPKPPHSPADQPSTEPRPQPVQPSLAQPKAQRVESDKRLQFPSLQPMIFAEARTYQVIDDSTDFTPYKPGDFHPVLSAHSDKEPNAELNSMLDPVRETNEDPLFEETEEDDSNQVESEDESKVSESLTKEVAKDDEPVELSNPQQAAASPQSKSELSSQPETSSTTSPQLPSTLPAINPHQHPGLSIPKPRTTPMDELVPEEPISPPEVATTSASSTEAPVGVAGIEIATISLNDSDSSVANRTEPLRSNEQQLSTSDKQLHTESVEQDLPVVKSAIAQPETDVVTEKAEDSLTADTQEAKSVESSVVKEISAPNDLFEEPAPPNSVLEPNVDETEKKLVEQTKPQSRLQAQNFEQEPSHSSGGSPAKIDTILPAADDSAIKASVDPLSPVPVVESSGGSEESPELTTTVPATESTSTLSLDQNVFDEEEPEPYDIATMLMWTVFCVICVTTLTFTKWIFSSVSSSTTSSIRVPENLTKVEQEVVTKRNSLASLKENLGLDQTANLKEQARRLKVLNQKLARRLERKSKLAPIKGALDTLKADLGDNIDDKISQRKLYIQNMKNIHSLLDKNNDLKKKIDQSRYEHLIMIRNFVRLEDLMDLMRDIEFNKVSNSLKESTFATEVETDFLKEQIGTFKDIVQKLSEEYDSLKKDIAEEKSREASNEEELVKLKDLCDQIDINDSVDDWKRRVDDKYAETDKYYKDYINNYYYCRYMHDFPQQGEVS